MLAVVNCNLPVSDLNCSHSFYDTDQRPVAISELYLSIQSFFDVMFHTHSAGFLISSTVLVERENRRSRSEYTGGVLSSQ